MGMFKVLRSRRCVRSERIQTAIVVLAVAAHVLGPSPAVQAAVVNASTRAGVIPPIQSCDNAYDQTGVGGAGIGQIRAVGNGIHSFSVTFNPEFIATHPPTTEFVWGEARIFVDGVYGFSIPTGHVHPISEAFHSHIQLQGHRYGPGNRNRIQRGNFLTFRVALLLIDPASGTFYPGNGTISCRI